MKIHENPWKSLNIRWFTTCLILSFHQCPIFKLAKNGQSQDFPPKPASQRRGSASRTSALRSRPVASRTCQGGHPAGHVGWKADSLADRWPRWPLGDPGERIPAAVDHQDGSYFWKKNNVSINPMIPMFIKPHCSHDSSLDPSEMFQEKQQVWSCEICEICEMSNEASPRRMATILSSMDLPCSMASHHQKRPSDHLELSKVIRNTLW